MRNGETLWRFVPPDQPVPEGVLMAALTGGWFVALSTSAIIVEDTEAAVERMLDEEWASLSDDDREEIVAYVGEADWREVHAEFMLARLRAAAGEQT